jgi:hypothetical protein
MMGFFSQEKRRLRAVSGKRQIAPQRAAFKALLAPNPGP